MWIGKKKIGKEMRKREKQKDKVGQRQSRKYSFQREFKANDLVKGYKPISERIRDGFLESSWRFLKSI